MILDGHPRILAVFRDSKNPHGTFGCIIELMRDERVITFLRHPKFHDSSSARREQYGLHAVKPILRVSVQINGVKNGADDMKGRYMVRTKITDVETNGIPCFGE